MSLVFLVLAGGFALVAAVVVGRDAARRGAPWHQAGAAAGCVVLFGCSVVLAYADPLAALYASVTGRPESVLMPRELTILLSVVGAALTVAVLVGYGLLTRARIGT